MGWEYLWILAVVSAVLCAVGFYKFVYFLSIGYGFAIAGLGVAILILFRQQAAFVHVIQCLLFLAYGARLSGFLLYREIKNAAYRKTLAEATTAEKGMPVFVKACIWIFVTVLYVAQVSPVFYRQYNGVGDTLLPWIGVIISIAALIIESLADKQKSQQKAKRPDMVATEGLYKMVRCPNYFGEILVLDRRASRRPFRPTGGRPMAHGYPILYRHRVYHVQRGPAAGKTPAVPLRQQPRIQGLCR